MGSWDELCLLCGIAPSGGCSSMLHKSRLEEYAREIAEEIKPGDKETLQIVRDALDAFLAKEKEGLGFRHAWLPEGMGRAQYNTRGCIAVGYFNQWGECEVRGDKVPDGRRVEVRRVRDCDSHSFSVVIREVDGRDKEFYEPSECSVTRENNPNFALCEHCYRYLEAWLDHDSLPASSSPREPLSFASELYEIVNSRTSRRNRDTTRAMLLQEIDYGGIEDTVEQWQDHLIPGRRGTKHLAKAIEVGLRGAELIPAVLRDCRAWMFMCPDTWPEPGSETGPPSHIIFKPATPAAMPLIGQLPNELLLPILVDIPLQSTLALASTCRSLYVLIMQPSFLDRVLKESILRGSLRWVLPAKTIPDEARNAYNALRLWFPEEHRPEPYPEPSDMDDAEDPAYDEEDTPEETENSPKPEENQAQPPADVTIPEQPLPSLESLVLSPHFPAIAFVRACWSSDSMMNRKRLWGQVCQFQELWRDYRLHGWQVDRFFPSEEIGMANN